jgi:hypothetical protein
MDTSGANSAIKMVKIVEVNGVIGYTNLHLQFVCQFVTVR